MSPLEASPSPSPYYSTGLELRKLRNHGSHRVEINVTVDV